VTRGPSPKPNAQRRNLHPGAQELGTAAQPGRELPKALGITSAGGKRFWDTWSKAPQTEHWLSTDWAELEITVKLVDEYFKGEFKHAAEIRQRVAKWGATVEDRNRLRMTIETEDPEEGPEATPETPPEVDMDEELYKLLNGS
jgi:hypothetical protein